MTALALYAITGVLKCTSCGAEIGENHRFCPACGVSTSVEAETQVLPATFAKQSLSGQNPSRQTSALHSSSSHSDGRFFTGSVFAGRYRIIALLGKGGMGEVYRAEDLSLSQQVALKFLAPSITENPEVLERFRNEVRIARQVSHPNVCRVYDIGEFDGTAFLSMEYVDGEDLGSLLRRIGRLPADKALEIARKLCAGLAAAHEKGVLHRDLKPGNIMLDARGQVLLTDFGLAGLAGQIRGSEVRNGTPAYMAPEQLAGKDVTERSDIYSLGLVLYEIFTGKRPFEADTLAGVMRAQQENTPVSLTTLVRDLDPSVERAVLRCLDPDPTRRPPTPLAIAAALPGGDPLAAALAAGETPSPQMLVAAGEGNGLKPAVGVGVLAGILAALVFIQIRSYDRNPTKSLASYSAEALPEKAKETIERLGYTQRPADRGFAYEWNNSLIDYVAHNEKPVPDWARLFSERPPVLQFWFRQSSQPMMSNEFHTDLLTQGDLQFGDPPGIESGMIRLKLDAQGRLNELEAMPPERLEKAGETRAPEWDPLFSAAGLDAAKLQPADPLWNFLAASDRRAAWTGVWPGTQWPLRVEAAALHGKPVAFKMIGPWTKPQRMPQPPPDNVLYLILSLLVLAISVCLGAAFLARRNFRLGRGDQRGAFRIASWMFTAHMLIWLCQVHFTVSIAVFGSLMIEISTAVFYGVVSWTLYLALEPYVRRRWPRTLISSTSVLSGRFSDPVVGRDALFGIALGVLWQLVSHRLFGGPINEGPRLASEDILGGFRVALGSCLREIPYGIRNALLFFFLLFLLRVLLRNSWLACAAWTGIFTTFAILGSSRLLPEGLETAVTFGLASFFILRFGLLTFAVALYVDRMLGEVPYLPDPSTWYFSNAAFVISIILALLAWSFYISIRGQRLWKRDLFDS